MSNIVPFNKNLALYVSQKVVKLQIPEVVNGLSSLELKIAKAGVSTPITLMGENDLKNDLPNILLRIAVKMGIRDCEISQAVDVFKFVVDYYSSLSIAEICLSFELSLVGALDDFLPKDREGNPDNKHYQQFSLEYVSKILNAYQKKKGIIWNVVNNLLPMETFTISEEQQRKNDIFFNEKIVREFYLFKEKSKKPEFLMSWLVIERLKKFNLINIPLPTGISEEHTERAINDVKFNRKPIHSMERMRILNDLKNGKIDDLINQWAGSMQEDDFVIQIFEDLISKNIKIEEILK